MTNNILDELKERGLVKQTVYEDELKKLLSTEKVVCYIGVDPTAGSLHVGNLASFMMLLRMQRAGHHPIAIVGGATGRIGDPSGRNDMRAFMSEEVRKKNIENIKNQLTDLFNRNGVDVENNKLTIVNNDDWMSKLSYYDMLEAVGLSMTVNRMLSHDCFKTRMETGLTFLEFNYMPMQAYDFLHLFKNYNCVLEMGGDDQWANILAGVELIRKKENKPAYCMTTPLLTKADGTKMGKSAGGAVWLSREMFSDYDFYQYFRNVEDEKIYDLFCQLTFLPLDEIKEICKFKGKELNNAKERLAFEITKIVRGEESAKKVQAQAKSAFGGNKENLVEIVIDKSKVNTIVDLLVESKLATSRGDTKKLIDGKAVKIDDNIVQTINEKIEKGTFVLSKGKKSIQKVILK